MVSRGKAVPMYITKSGKVKRSINKVVNIKGTGECLQAFEDASLLIYGVPEM